MLLLTLPGSTESRVPQRLDPGTAPNRAHPVDRWEVADAHRGRRHQGRALPAPAHFHGHGCRHPGVYQRDHL